MQFREKIRSCHPFTKALLWVAFMLGGGLLWMICSMVFGMCHVSGVALFDSLEVLQSLLIFIVPAVCAALCWTERPMAWLHLDKGIRWQQALLIPLTIAVAIPGINLLSWLNQQIPLPDVLQRFEDLAADQLEAVLQMPNAGWLVVNLLVMALFPAVGEEICFRGMCFGLINPTPERTNDPDYMQASVHLSRRTHIAIWVVAIIFSAIHLQFAGFIPRMLLGAVLGYLYCWTGSIWGSALAHFTNNACVVIFYFISQHSSITEEALDAFGTGSQWWIGALSLALAGGMLWIVRKTCGKSAM